MTKFKGIHAPSFYREPEKIEALEPRQYVRPSGIESERRAAEIVDVMFNQLIRRPGISREDAYKDIAMAMTGDLWKMINLQPPPPVIYSAPPLEGMFFNLPTTKVLELPVPVVLTAKMRKAMTFAAERQMGRLDKGGQPYIVHSLSVAFAVAHFGEDEFVTACCHDLVEDREATFLEIRQLFGDTIRTAVEGVTRDIVRLDGEIIRKEKYFDFIARCKRNPISRRVKLADLADNTRPERIEVLPETERDIVRRYKKAEGILNS